MTLKELRKAVWAAQERLSLRDWEIDVRWATDKGDDAIGDNHDAEIWYEETHRCAIIRFRKPKRGRDVSLETIYHELIHVWFSPFKIPPGDINEEVAVCAIAKALANS